MTRVCFSTVHGETVNGRFHEHVNAYAQHQLETETDTLAAHLREAAGHIEDATLAEKYRTLAQHQNFHHGFVTCQSGPLLSMARGRVCQQFLDQTDADWLFMIDSDITFAPQTPKMMVDFADAQREERGLKLLGGVVWILQFDGSGQVVAKAPNLYKWVNFADGEYMVPIGAEELPDNGLVEVGGVGAAVLLIHRELLVKIRDEVCGGRPFWWHHLPSANGDQYGEDTSFCVRVRQAGERVWVHTLPEFGHVKGVTTFGDTQMYRGQVPTPELLRGVV